MPNDRDAAPPIALVGLEFVHDETTLDGREEDNDGGSDAYIVEGACDWGYANPPPSGTINDPDPVRVK